MGAYLRKYELVCEKSANYHIASRISEPGNIADILVNSIGVDKYMQEHFSIFVLDTKLNVVGYHEISRGTLNSSPVHPRDVFQAAIATPKCAAIIVTHNHPSGDPTPSRDDIELTKRLINGGEILGVPVMDHIITGDNNYISLKEYTDLF